MARPVFVRCQPDMSEDLFFAATTMSSSQFKPPSSDDASSLERVREKNEAVKESVEQSAQELVVINAVLKQEISDHVQTGELAQALENTNAIEERLQESADGLAEANQALEQEIGERAELERELATTKAALEEAIVEAQKN